MQGEIRCLHKHLNLSLPRIHLRLKSPLRTELSRSFLFTNHWLVHSATFCKRLVRVGNLANMIVTAIIAHNSLEARQAGRHGKYQKGDRDALPFDLRLYRLFGPGPLPCAQPGTEVSPNLRSFLLSSRKERSPCPVSLIFGANLTLSFATTLFRHPSLSRGSAFLCRSAPAACRTHCQCNPTRELCRFARRGLLWLSCQAKHHLALENPHEQLYHLLQTIWGLHPLVYRSSHTGHRAGSQPRWAGPMLPWG